MSAESAPAAKPPPPPAAGSKLFFVPVEYLNYNELSHGIGLDVSPGWAYYTGSYNWGWSNRLKTSGGNALGLQTATQESVNGPVGGGLPTHAAFSAPVASDFTLSGTVTFNVWGIQASDVNSGIAGRLYRLRATGELDLIVAGTAPGELNVSCCTRGVKNWTAIPTLTPIKRGDRFVLWFSHVDGSGNMIAGPGIGNGNIEIDYNGATANANGDTWVQLSEGVTFQDDQADAPTGSTFYLRDSASALAPGAGFTAREMLETAGASEVSAAANTVAGPVGPATTQWTKTTGGDKIEWYSPGLNSFTLAGVVLVRIFANTSNQLSRSSVVAELARVNGDGSNAVVWSRQLMRHKGGQQNNAAALSTTRYSIRVTLAGPDLSVAAGQRLRLRLYLDDDYGFSGVLQSGYTSTLYYGDSDDADSTTGAMARIRLSQTVSEYSGPPPPPPPSVPGTILLDNFNRANETPVSQGGNWALVGVHGGSGAPLGQNRLQNFPQPGYSYRVTPYLGGDMEAWATIFGRPGQSDWLSLFICVQDAGTTGWDGYELRATNVNGGPDLWEVRRVDNGAAAVLASTSFEIAAGGSMLLRRNGLGLQFWWKPPGGAWSQKLVDELSLNDTAYRWGVIGAGGYKTGSLDDFGGGSLLSLLDQYAPELRFTNQEVYRTADAAIATDLYFPGPNHTNVLKRPDAGGDYVVAAADPGAPEGNLSLDYLNTQAQNGDFLAQPNFYGDAIASAANDYSAWVTDANHQSYNRVAYGRVIPNPTTGEKLLQYWFFYYYNPKNVSGVAGHHEGDWEWLQVRLNQQDVPLSVSASQHGSGEVCAWGYRTSISGGGHPIAYVAYESHANYFTPGDHTVIPFVFTDYTQDAGQLYREVPRVLDVTANAPRWISSWDGRWGASTAENSSSPSTPGLQPAWDAWTWEAGAGACTVPSYLRSDSTPGAAKPTGTHDGSLSGGTAGSATGVPALPRIRSARIVSGTKYGKAARISYCFASLPSNPSTRPWRLHLTVDNVRDRFPPLTVPWKVTTRCSVVTQPVGGIKAPYVLRYSVESKSGTRSKQAQRPLK